MPVKIDEDLPASGRPIEERFGEKRRDARLIIRLLAWRPDLPVFFRLFDVL